MKQKSNNNSAILNKAESKTEVVEESVLFENIAKIIENRKFRAIASANIEITLMYWEIGHYINSTILDFKRAEYGKKILNTLCSKLIKAYGKNFDERNLYYMTQFANTFTDLEMLTKWASVLSWSHFRELIRIKDDDWDRKY
jgi:hypothetical protein